MLPLFLSNKVPLMHSSGTQFFIKPVFPRGFSCFLHSVLLFGLLITYVLRKRNKDGSKERRTRVGDFWYAKILEYCCVGVSVFYVVFSVLCYFYWYQNGRFEEKLVTLLDFVLRSLAWLAIFVYFRGSRFFSELKFHIWLRVWSGLGFGVSCYCLVVDVLCKDRLSVSLQFWVADVVSIVVGLGFCCVGLFWRSQGDGGVLEEPLLNGESNGRESSEARGGESVTPYAHANVFSLLSFSWMAPLVAFGYKKTLDLEDVPQLASIDSVRGVFPCLRGKLESDGGIGSGITTCKLVKALIFSVRREIILTALLALANTLASYVGPYLIDTFVQYLDGQRDFENEGYLLVSAFLVAKLVECLTQRHWFFKLQQSGIRARGALIAVIYNKALSLSCQSRQGQTSGEIINLMSVDAERVGDFGWYMHDPWIVILQVALALLILYKDLGLASIAALVATILVMLINIPIGSRLENYQQKVMKSKDNRMKATSEVLRNMRILKLQGWEMKFLSKITELRKTEAAWLKKFVYTSAMTTFVFWGAPTFVSVFTFGACMVLGIPLQAGKILSALATFRILQEPIYNLPDTISMIAQTKVSLDRIVAFLRLDDLQPDVIERLPKGSSDTAIEIVNGNFSWDPSSSSATLRDINLKVQRGMKVAVCGTVGSGKSSLLSCILGEVPKISGTLRMCGTRAYVAQLPWIQSGKIEENILFGKDMDRERYSKVLESCALNKDLEILNFGDQTVIGERGINLSGGQKQRIQIARALYQDADIYIFDDPFSAVDAHTGSHLFKLFP